MLLKVDYLLLGTPGVLLALWAWWRGIRVRIESTSDAESWGLTGAEAAKRVLDFGGIEHVTIEVADGPLTNHYDSVHHRLRLSENVYRGRNAAAIGMASHEAAHAIQSTAGSCWSWIRWVLVPTASLGSILSWLLILAGISLDVFRLTVWGLAVFSLTVLAQLANLGAEFDANRRARIALADLTNVEESTRKRESLAKAQDAAAWSHVAEVLAGFPAHVCREIKSAFPWPGAR